MSASEDRSVNSRAQQAGVRQRWQRLGRLTLKELREILRDRRTIITLVLMPVLVYPLLSMVFQQYFLTRAGSIEKPKYVIGLKNEEEARFLQQLINNYQQDEAGDLATNAEIRTDKPDFSYVEANEIESAIRDSQIDLGVEFEIPENQALDAGADLAVDFKLIYDVSSVNGRLSAEYIQNSIEQANTDFLAERLKRLGVEQRAEPIATEIVELESEQVFGPVTLSSVIPLILILMTITGAVYPAIDLTAGERERGTLEVLIAAPIPRMGLLIAKYIAVLTVAMLTATVNLVMMTITISVSGLGQALFGEGGISLQTMVQVFCLLLLFAMFFSAVLLTLTSFARSFKEAQAYLIPLMLLSLAPGVMSLMPGLKLSGTLAVVPLVNIVLLGRDLMESRVELASLVTVVVSTSIYALAAIAIAGRIFGAEGVLYSTEGSWSDALRRPEEPSARPTLSNAMFCLACLFPAYFVVSSLVARAEQLPVATRLLLSAAGTGLLFGIFPLIAAYVGRVRLLSGFSLSKPPWMSVVGAAMLGFSLWVFAIEFFLQTSSVQLDDRFEELAEKILVQLRSVHPAIMILVYAIFPATFEEFTFRGYLYNAIRPRTSALQTILATAVIFGLFHFILQGVLAPARLANSTVLGIVLGWLRYKSGSIVPGIVMHSFHNGILLVLEHYKSELADRFPFFRVLQDSQIQLAHLPLSWLAVAAVIVVAGIAFVQFSPRQPDD